MYVRVYTYMFVFMCAHACVCAVCACVFMHLLVHMCVLKVEGTPIALACVSWRSSHQSGCLVQKSLKVEVYDFT